MPPTLWLTMLRKRSERRNFLQTSTRSVVLLYKVNAAPTICRCGVAARRSSRRNNVTTMAENIVFGTNDFTPTSNFSGGRSVRKGVSISLLKLDMVSCMFLPVIPSFQPRIFSALVHKVSNHVQRSSCIKSARLLSVIARVKSIIAFLITPCARPFCSGCC